ncbi:hypothetical protein [Vibrio sp. J383]|uniref:hypothetical protein n=1 Tax=Vibrio sp. J383 TaxID=2942997 RepID=UPI0020BD85AD|nr:hypothetical protein [Vibrio sp. J383]UQV24841.1 hypothetical protein M4S28_26230 [Vibrio sp. J383]
MNIEYSSSKAKVFLLDISRFLAQTSVPNYDIIQIAIFARLAVSNLEPRESVLEKKLERSIYRLYFAVKCQSQYLTQYQEAVIIDSREVLKQWLHSSFVKRSVMV